MALGDRIRDKRESKGMTLRELAAKIGVTEATVSRYESNQIKNPTNVKLRQIAEALGTDVNYLMDWEGNDEAVRYGGSECYPQIELDEDEMELIEIYRSLSRRKKHEMMAKAYEFERRGAHETRG